MPGAQPPGAAHGKIGEQRVAFLRCLGRWFRVSLSHTPGESRSFFNALKPSSSSPGISVEKFHSITFPFSEAGSRLPITSHTGCHCCPCKHETEPEECVWKEGWLSSSRQQSTATQQACFILMASYLQSPFPSRSPQNNTGLDFSLARGHNG